MLKALPWVIVTVISPRQVYREYLLSTSLLIRTAENMLSQAQATFPQRIIAIVGHRHGNGKAYECIDKGSRKNSTNDAKGVVSISPDTVEIHHMPRIILLRVKLCNQLYSFYVMSNCVTACRLQQAHFVLDSEKLLRK